MTRVHTPVLVAPMRRLFELLGCEVKWTSNDEDIIVTKGDYSLTFRINSSVFDRHISGFNFRNIPLGGRARLEGSGMDARTVIPLMAPLQALGYTLRATPSIGIRTSAYVITEHAMNPPLPWTPEPFSNPTYVLLDEIVARNNEDGDGGITAFTTNDGRDARRVTIRGITHELVVGGVIINQDGFLIARRSHIMFLFGLSVAEATHQAWDWYGNETRAALAFSLIWTPYATDRNFGNAPNLEAAAIIYRIDNSYFTFGTPWTNRGDILGPNVIFGLIDRVVFRFDPGRPDNSEFAGLAHTHPTRLYPDHNRYRLFSNEDMDVADGAWHLWQGRLGIPAMPVILSRHENGTGSLIVRRYDRFMNRNRNGVILFSR